MDWKRGHSGQAKTFYYCVLLLLFSLVILQLSIQRRREAAQLLVVQLVLRNMQMIESIMTFQRFFFTFHLSPFKVWNVFPKKICVMFFLASGITNYVYLKKNEVISNATTHIRSVTGIVFYSFLPNSISRIIESGSVRFLYRLVAHAV